MKRLIWGQAADKGLVNDKNEDGLFSFGLATLTDALHHIGLFIIADGVGEGLSGVWASRQAVSVAASELFQSVITPFAAQQPYPWIPDAIRTAIQAANQELIERISRDPHLKTATSTIDVALVIDDAVCIGHVGASRTYVVTVNDVEQLTEDHHVIGFLKKNDRGSKVDTTTHRLTNVLTRALGQTDTLEIDTITHTIKPDECMLLCTDGLTRLVPPKQFVEVLRTSPDVQLASEQLIKLANDRGGIDNTTVITFAYH